MSFDQRMQKLKEVNGVGLDIPVMILTPIKDAVYENSND